MPLIRQGAAGTDEFTALGDDAPLSGGPVLVGLTRFLAQREALLARNSKLGVRLTAAQSPEELGADVQRLSLIVIEMSSFRDGRAFSQARLLRTRMNFAGEIRAAGAFLPDQLAFLTRCGFDAFDGDHRITPEALRTALAEISAPYQPSADGAPAIRDLRVR